MAEFWQLYQAHHEALRSILFLFGFLLACVGVYLGFRRLAATEKQANTAERNLFNDRLGRGVALLSDDKMTVHSAGVRVLENLASGTDADSEEHRLVFDILLDFVRDKAAPNMKGGRRFDKDEDALPLVRRDVELALFALGNITPEGRRKKINLSSLDLQNLRLVRVKLRGAILRGCNLNDTNLLTAKLKDADLQEARLENALLMWANLENARLSFSSLNEARSAIGADISGARRDGWEEEILQDAVYDRDNLPQDYVGGSITSLRISHRAYEWKDGKRFFVQSDMPESDQDVDEWIKKEIAEAEGKN